ncbi:MAG: 2-oxoacid:acceptor oxidoreductase family protein [Chloroflexi bacterium]|nr:2-oxoacid:acceptor oxidoreductase family protein [Chloroflexota bacterium]
MHEEIIIAGFGGQGVLFAGQLLAYAGLHEGKQVAWVPSYGPEMRGGTAHVTVIISEEEIGSLVVARPTIAVAMNLPSLERYEPAVKPGGILAVNSSLAPDQPKRADVLNLVVPASDIASEVGNVRLAAMVIIGAVLAARPFVSLESATEALKKVLPDRRGRLLELNATALRRGAQKVERLEAA